MNPNYIVLFFIALLSVQPLYFSLERIHMLHWLWTAPSGAMFDNYSE